MPLKQPTYLGDGVYVRYNDFGIIELYTSDGLRETNLIVLELEVVANFKRWLDSPS